MTRPMPHRTSLTPPAAPPPPPGVGLPWIVSILVLALVTGLATYEAGGSIVSSILAGLLALPVVGVPVYSYTRKRRGSGPPAALVTLVAALGVGVPTVGMASCMGGCTAGTQQRTVTALAAGAVAADEGLATAFEIAAATVADEVLEAMPDAAGDERWAEWCRRIQPVWNAMARVECGVIALADAARAGQGLIDAAAARADLEEGGGSVSASAWARWAAPAASLLAAVMAGWTAVDGEVPEELQQAWALLELLAGPETDLNTTCEVGPPPGCAPALEVSP